MSGRANPRFPLIEGMRGAAALSVLLYHGVYKAYLILTADHNPGREYFAHLDVGVTLFFVISGFVLYRPFVRARLETEPAPDTDAYAWRRLLRIVPAYWVVLVIAGLAGVSYHGNPPILSLEGAPYYFGFLQIYDPQTAAGGINVAWTLCVEVTFYATLPLWAALMRRRTPRGSVAASELGWLALLAAGSMAFGAFAVHQRGAASFGWHASPWIEPLPNFLDQFAVGMALAVVSVAAQARERTARVPAWPLLAVAAVAYWVMSTRIGVTGGPRAGDHPRPVPAGTPPQDGGRGLALRRRRLRDGRPDAARPGRSAPGVLRPGLLRHLPVAHPGVRRGAQARPDHHLAGAGGRLHPHHRHRHGAAGVGAAPVGGAARAAAGAAAHTRRRDVRRQAARGDPGGSRGIVAAT